MALEAQTGKGLVTVQSRDNGARDEFHIVALLELCNEPCLAGEIAELLDNIDLLAAVGEENSLLESGIASAEHGYGLIPEESSVAHGAV